MEARSASRFGDQMKAVYDMESYSEITGKLFENKAVRRFKIKYFVNCKMTQGREIFH